MRGRINKLCHYHINSHIAQKSAELLRKNSNEEKRKRKRNTFIKTPRISLITTKIIINNIPVLSLADTGETGNNKNFKRKYLQTTN